MCNIAYEKVVYSILRTIEEEYIRLYWNKYQEEPNTPFENSCETYSNDTFTVRAYDWSLDDNKEVQRNFEYKDFGVDWYKYLGRGMTIYYNKKLNLDFLTTMLDDCIVSMRKDFGEEED